MSQVEKFIKASGAWHHSNITEAFWKIKDNLSLRQQELPLGVCSPGYLSTTQFKYWVCPQLFEIKHVAFNKDGHIYEKHMHKETTS